MTKKSKQIHKVVMNYFVPDELTRRGEICPPATFTQELISISNIAGMKEQIADHQRVWGGNSFELWTKATRAQNDRRNRENL